MSAGDLPYGCIRVDGSYLEQELFLEEQVVPSGVGGMPILLDVFLGFLWVLINFVGLRDQILIKRQLMPLYKDVLRDKLYNFHLAKPNMLFDLAQFQP